MVKIKTNKDYRKSMQKLGKQGRELTEQASEHQKQLEAETADFSQGLHDRETKGRPHNKE